MSEKERLSFSVEINESIRIVFCAFRRLCEAEERLLWSKNERVLAALTRMTEQDKLMREVQTSRPVLFFKQQALLLGRRLVEERFERICFKRCSNEMQAHLVGEQDRTYNIRRAATELLLKFLLAHSPGDLEKALYAVMRTSFDLVFTYPES